LKPGSYISLENQGSNASLYRIDVEAVNCLSEFASFIFAWQVGPQIRTLKAS